MGFVCVLGACHLTQHSTQLRGARSESCLCSILHQLLRARITGHARNPQPASQPASGGSSSGRLACSAARTAANSSRRCLCAHAAARAVSAQPGLGGSRMDSHTQLSAPSLRTVLGCAPAHGPRLSFFELCAQQEAPAHQTPAVPVLPACSPPLTLHNRLCAICW